MNSVQESPFIPGPSRQEYDARFIDSLLRVLIGIFQEHAFRLNHSIPNDASEEAEGLAVQANSPAQITAQEDDYDPGVGMVLRLDTDASRTVTGLEAPATEKGTGLGRILIVVNVGANNVVLGHENVASVAANRIRAQAGADITLTPDQVSLLWYDLVTQRWREIK